MSKAKTGDTVKVSYIGTFQDGTVFDQSKDDNLLEFTMGNQEVITGFESAVIDMETGETKKVTIPPEEAYGTYNEDDVDVVTRSRFPDNLEPKVGMQLEVQNRDSNPVTVTITSIDKNTITLDANHPLVDKELTFEITLKEIVNAV
jgi:peptidylprolyl isomerase